MVLSLMDDELIHGANHGPSKDMLRAFGREETRGPVGVRIRACRQIWFLKQSRR